MSNLAMARVKPLNAPLLGLAETHGRRLDKAAMDRKVRDEPSLTWVPDGITGDPLALADRLADHVEGAFIPKSATPLPTKALHMLVMLPDSVPVATKEEAQAAMELAVEFAQHVYGGRAVFSARIDRDEVSLNTVDVFLAPRYVKKGKVEKDAISMTKHSKELAVKHGHAIKGTDKAGKQISTRSSMQAQGRALQDELAVWLTEKGFPTDRGKSKLTNGDDWKSPEIMGARKDRAAAEKLRSSTAEDRAAIEGELEKDRAALDAFLSEKVPATSRDRTEAKRLLAEADRIKAEADAIVEAAAETKRVADLAAMAVAADRDQLTKDRDQHTADQRKLMTAQSQARTDDLRRAAKNADLGNRVKAFEEREAALEATFADRVAAGVTAGLAVIQQRVDETMAEFREFVPALRAVRDVYQRLANAPVQIRAWLDRDPKVAATIAAVPEMHKRLSGLSRWPAKPAPGKPDDGPPLVDQATAAGKGGSGR